jgi:serine/threonine protein kinase
MQIEVLGERYQLLDTIGRGGMAVIYRGRDLRMDRPVAIKVLREAYSTDPKFVTRFQLEAKAASSLQHPNIVQVYDYGYADGNYFIVMELVDGSDLRRYLRSRRILDVERAMIIAHDVASGLSAAHRRNIVHRDVKPQNILIGRDGSIKLTDFGIASVYKDINAERLTTTGMTLGTVQYYAPEQAQGEIVSPAADVYALGIVMYEMLTGRTPFDGDTPVAVAMQHLQDAPLPPRQLNPNIPPALEGIILRCLEKVPEMRFRDGSMLAQALELLGEEENVGNIPNRIPPSGPQWVSGSGVGHPPIPPRPTSNSRQEYRDLSQRSTSSPNNTMPEPAPPSVGPGQLEPAVNGSTYADPTIAESRVALSNFDQGQPASSGTGATRPFQRDALSRPGVVQDQRESSFASIITVLILIATLLLLGFSIYLAAMLGFIKIPGIGPSNTIPGTPQIVTVPSLIGMPKTNAQATANKAGLTLTLSPGSPQTGCVVNQDPPANDNASYGSQISVELGKCANTPTVQVTVPANLVGQPLVNVEAILSQANINYSLQSAGTDPKIQPDTVVRVNPPSGKPLGPNQAVTLYVMNCKECSIGNVTPTSGKTPFPSPSPTPTARPSPTPTTQSSPTPTTQPSPTPTTQPSPTPTTQPSPTPTTISLPIP